MTPSIADRLASHATNADPTSLTPAAMERLALCLADTLAVMKPGLGAPASSAVVRYAESFIGAKPWTSVPASLNEATLFALAGGVAAHAMDFDDAALGDVCAHISSVVIPACLALDGVVDAGPETFARAVRNGFVTEVVAAHTINPSSYVRGFHPTAVIGVLGSSVAAATLLGLNERQTRVALGVAASMSSGLKANFGTTTKPLHCGWPASSGIHAALLARSGLSSSADIFEAPSGLMSAFGGGDKTTERLTRAHELLDDPNRALVELPLLRKRWPCCASTYSPIACALELRASVGSAVHESTRVVCCIHPRRVKHVDVPQPTTLDAARSSIQFLVATALVDGQMTAEGDLRWPPRPSVTGLADKVEIGDLRDVVGPAEADRCSFGSVVILFRGTEEIARTQLMRPPGSSSLVEDREIVTSKLRAACGAPEDADSVLTAAQELMSAGQSSVGELLAPLGMY